MSFVVGAVESATGIGPEEIFEDHGHGYLGSFPPTEEGLYEAMQKGEEYAEEWKKRDVLPSCDCEEIEV